jgi:5-(carboxyamino)imidazole ribonucleotide mutase
MAIKKVKKNSSPIAIVMGSKSDWPTMKFAADILKEFKVPFIAKVVSAHRTPDLLSEFALSAEDQGIEVIIAGAGGAAHLPGMLAAQTVVPVLGVPVQSRSLNGLDSLLSIVQMPAGVPVGTLAIGEAGAKNAAYFALSIIAQNRPELKNALKNFRKRQSQKVKKEKLI